jgi:hypothetical protein
LLNSGNGRTYTHGPKIPAHKGVGDGAVAISNWKGTGRAAFVVNNGYQFNPAPPQLIEFDKS